MNISSTLPPVKYVGKAVTYTETLRNGPFITWGCLKEVVEIHKSPFFNSRIDAIALPSKETCGKYILVENYYTKRRLFILHLGIIGKDCAHGNSICITPSAAHLLGLPGKGDDRKGLVLLRWYDQVAKNLRCIYKIGEMCLSIGVISNNHGGI